MTKKERILAAFADATVDHVPVCFWWHFNPSLPHDEMVAAHLKFFHDTDEDLMKISSDGYFGWPAEALKAPHDVKKLYKIEHIPLSHPYMRGQIDRVKAIVSALNGEAMTVYTTFNPLSLIRLQVGWDQMMAWMREDHAAVMHACDVIAEDHMALMEALVKEGGADGFFYSVQNAELTRFTEQEYKDWVTPAELRELTFLQTITPYVVLHCCGWDADEAGTTDRLENWQNYPANMVSWARYVDLKNTPEIRAFFHGLPAWGGFDNRKGCLLQTGTKEEIQAETKRLIEEAGKHGFILGPDCSLPPMDPGRIRWIVEASRAI